MRYGVALAPEAFDDIKKLSARNRSRVRDAIKIHKRYESEKVSKSRLKRLRGISRPQYRFSLNPPNDDEKNQRGRVFILHFMSRMKTRPLWS